MNWKLFTSAKSAKSAGKVMQRFIDAMQCEYEEPNIEPYNKGGYVCSFSVGPVATLWPEVVVEALSKAQGVGRNWMLSGDVESELDAWSNESNISGVDNIHLLVAYNA